MLYNRIAGRYLRSKKSHAAVNIISWVAIAGVALAAASMVIVLSVFNGFGDLINSRMSALEPDFTVTAAQGKAVANADSLVRAIEAATGSGIAYAVVEERGFAINGFHQSPVKLRGIESTSPLLRAISPWTIDGLDDVGLTRDSFNMAMLSVGVANVLTAPPSPINFIKVYVPRRRGCINPSLPMNAFRADSVLVAGVFRCEDAQFDEGLMLMPLQAARHLMDYTSQASYVEVWLPDGVTATSRGLEKQLGPGYVVKSRIEQHESAFRMVNIEKYVTLLMLTFILVIASFNILSAMSILIVEKRGNMAVFRAMGASERFTRKIFVALTRRIALTGGVAGIIIGVILALLQQYCGLIKLSATDPSMLAVQAYPVKVAPLDLVIVAAIVAAIGWLASLIIDYSLRPRRKISSPAGECNG